ncbi:carbamoyltransferase HypF [Virgisporangium aliadipatigenens]|uniref:Carbamoyltransferase n=1 Tax=Virgisporangium aliadipatigenens TaxID=741659 RepID=A0A8J3YPV9_9ACTN|nr:carbamoyltransferase HypF [Virgisporangium aliadipatigenens]GIJ48138.1 carbamoyltransferase HypF [Virgisporangium aliadipatigenens]
MAADRSVEIEVRGTVQGVGFRPFVHRLATAHGLAGDVRNAGGTVVIRLRGDGAGVASFLRRLAAEAPSAARVGDVRARDLPVGAVPVGGFRIGGSTTSAVGVREVPPDLATCPDCRAELADPTDRRYRYPFVNCTACGPRATIIDDLPYDRVRTAMSTFPLCAACAAEYAAPADRRFHAEPVACPDCGPRLCWWPGGVEGAEAFAAAVAALEAGSVVAVKGIGGYQLLCDAADAHAVAHLRAAKHRPRKPFAVMVPDLAAARRLAALSPAQERVLSGPAAPIVLAVRRPGTPLAAGVCGGSAEIGLFLPYSPLHHLLLAALDRPLVVTSGNVSGAPIVVDDAVARAALGTFAAGILGHDRPIRSRYDDSVVRLLGDRTTVLRRARGLAPAPVPLPVPAREPVLAVGAQLKHTVTLAVGTRAVPGPHTGDLSDAAAYQAFTDTVERLCRWHAVTPHVVAHDLHPGYLSTRFARSHEGRRIAVQHHHAHVAAVAAEHGITGPVLGVAYDGLGLGDDGTLWGGEILLATLTGYRRLARFARAPLPGGESAVRHPARTALGHLYGAEELGGARPDPRDAAVLWHTVDPRTAATVRELVARRVNAPLASSAGRLFDTVSALLGLCATATYEGEAAVLLETAAAPYGPVPALPWRLANRDGLLVYDPAPTLRAVLAHGGAAGEVAAAFHTTVAEVTEALLTEAARATGVRTVCLGGGVFANRRLTTDLLDRLPRAGFTVHIGASVPSNDGGISYGQAAVAAALSAKE